jgi:hypothetical protein
MGCQGIQQNVVGMTGVTVPVGWPPLAAQLPPVGGVMTADRPITPGLLVRLPQLPASKVASGVLHTLGARSLYTVIDTLQLLPAGVPHWHGVQPRVSITFW